jgi:hypothetical protein
MSADQPNLPPIKKGTTYRVSMTWYDEQANPTDLTGCTALLQVRQSYDSAEVLLELSTENDGITLGGALGTIELYIPDSTTSAFAWSKGKYDCLLMMANGDVISLFDGDIAVVPGVTRR